MTEIVVVVSGGMVQDVYSNNETVKVTVLDYDTEEGQVLSETADIPNYHVY